MPSQATTLAAIHDKVREIYQALRKFDPALAERHFKTFIFS